MYIFFPDVYTKLSRVEEGALKLLMKEELDTAERKTVLHTIREIHKRDLKQRKVTEAGIAKAAMEKCNAELNAQEKREVSNALL